MTTYVVPCTQFTDRCPLEAGKICMVGECVYISEINEWGSWFLSSFLGCMVNNFTTVLCQFSLFLKNKIIIWRLVVEYFSVHLDIVGFRSNFFRKSSSCESVVKLNLASLHLSTAKLKINENFFYKMHLYLIDENWRLIILIQIFELFSICSKKIRANFRMSVGDKLLRSSETRWYLAGWGIKFLILLTIKKKKIGIFFEYVLVITTQNNAMFTGTECFRLTNNLKINLWSFF